MRRSLPNVHKVAPSIVETFLHGCRLSAKQLLLPELIYLACHRLSRLLLARRGFQPYSRDHSLLMQQCKTDQMLSSLHYNELKRKEPPPLNDRCLNTTCIEPRARVMHGLAAS